MVTKRGRPIGTKRRSEAAAAARAILAGQFSSLRDAATAFRPTHIGSDDGFRDFIDTVEEALREIISTEPGSFRAYRAMAQRGRNRRAQPIVQRHERDALKRHLNEVLGWDLRCEAGSENDR